MQQKFTSYITLILLFGLLVLPVGSASAQTAASFPGASAANVSGGQDRAGDKSVAAVTLPNLLLDPSFEAAYTSTTNWKQASTNSDTPLCKIVDCSTGGGTAGPRTGNVWAWFGGIDSDDPESIWPEVGDLYQNVTFPTCGATLTFYLWIGFAQSGSDANDLFSVKIDGTTVFTANATQKSSYLTYTLVTVDVSAYANGGTHKVEFYSITTDQNVTFNLEDVSLTRNCFTISGNAGVAGATLNYTGGSTTADGSGNYSFKPPAGWSGTVTPSKTNYTFSPESRTYSDLGADITGQNYTATAAVTISGNVGVTGVTLSYTDGTPKTALSEANGDYSFIVSNNWSGTVTPSHECFTFTPIDRTYNNVTTSQTNQNYTPSAGSSNLCVSQSTIDFAEQLYYTKSGSITTTLTNNQAIDAHMGSFQRSSGQFILSSNTCAGATLTPGQTCSFDMQFKPTAYGALSGTLTINSDAPDSPLVITLDGTGLSGTQLVTKGGSFEQDNNNDTIPDFWAATGLAALDGRSNQFAKHGFYSVKLVGQPGTTKTLKQTIVKNGLAGDDFLYVLWSKAENVPGGLKYRTQVSFYNGATLVERRIKDYTSGTHHWEYKWLPMTVSGNYTSIEIEIIYSLPSGTAWFDSNSLKWAP
jgi:hypothetical protein